MRRFIATSVALALLVTPALAADQNAGDSVDTPQIDKLTGLKGKLDEKEQVYKVSAPRSDLRIFSRTVHITPPMGLTSWAAFKRAGNQTMVMGDIVLEQDQ